MNDQFAAAMRAATLSTSAFNLAEATRTIQDALMGRAGATAPAPLAPDITPPMQPSRPKPFPVDPQAEIIEPLAHVEPAPKRPRRSLGDTLKILTEARALSGNLPGLAKRSGSPAIPDRAQYLQRTFTFAAGARRYKLYVPASAQPTGLVVMLHGCQQDPDDFAVGTGMNAVAEAHGLLVAYPGQTSTDNSSSCWNWFRPSDQKRGAGEPAIIAGITEEIVREYDLDRSQVFVAGLSAGGAMAAVVAEAYPDLYAAVGIHSGLACGTASDVVSAFAAMRGDVGTAQRSRTRNDTGPTPRARTIVFHGDADRTVHPANAGRIVAAAMPSIPGDTFVRPGRSDGGLTYDRTIVTDETGNAVLESWLVKGAGHAWSGGDARGSYTDPRGPDASAEMVRFFLDQRDLSRSA